MYVHRQLKPFLSAAFPQFKFKPKPPNNIKFDKISQSADLSKYAQAYLGAKKYQTLGDLEIATTELLINEAISEIYKLSHLMTETDLIRICRAAIRNDSIQEHAHEDNIEFF